jgi:hypothetical protein
MEKIARTVPAPRPGYAPPANDRDVPLVGDECPCGEHGGCAGTPLFQPVHQGDDQ